MSKQRQVDMIYLMRSFMSTECVGEDMTRVLALFAYAKSDAISPKKDSKGLIFWEKSSPPVRRSFLQGISDNDPLFLNVKC